MVGKDFPGGEGEVAELIRTRDWSGSPLGPPSQWPSHLRAAIEMILPAHAEIVLFWGEDFLAFYNDTYAPTIGGKHPSALGQPARLYWSELWDDLEPLLRRVRDTGETVSAKDRPFQIERHGYPETVYFDISYSPLRGDDDRVAGVLCIVRETTVQVRALAELRENESRFSAIIEQASAGIAQCDLDGRFTLVNQRFCEIVGYTSSDLLAMRMQDITHADDLPANMVQFARLVQDGTVFVIEKRYVRRDGSLVWVRNSVGLIRDAAGQPSQVLAVVSDITERKRAEESERRLAAIIASSEDAILSTDLDMHITSWNQGAQALYGYCPEEVMGRLVTLLVPDDRGDEEPSIIASISRGERVLPYETQRLHKDGRLIDVSLTVSPILDEHGRVVGASKIARDITERKQAERLQAVVLREMQHRVKNIFATVQAMARQTFRGHSDTSTALQAFDGRVLAMTRAHALLSSKTWDSAELSAVIRQATAAYDGDRFEICGPDVRLSPRAALSLSLALHELATNAAKYGALTGPEGKVRIVWHLSAGADAALHLEWKETGGPAVIPPTHKGFGSRLIQDVLATELDGNVAIHYEPDGLSWVVDAPLETGWEN